MSEMAGLADKPTAVVTGATSGIGKAIALELAKQGYDTIAIGRSSAVLDEMRATPGIYPLAMDITDREGLSAALEDQKVDVFVSNAGIIPKPVGFAEMDQADIDETLEINLSAAIAAVRLVLPGMIQRRSGHVIFTGSIAGQAPFPNMAVYGASKAAISSFAAALRCDLSGTGIRVTEVIAGRVQTRLYRNAVGEQALADMYSNYKPVQPEDVARMISAVLMMPAHVDVTRFDILPTAQYVGGGGYAASESE